MKRRTFSLQFDGAALVHESASISEPPWSAGTCHRYPKLSSRVLV